MQFKTRGELIPAIEQLLAEKPEANLMIIVDGDAGMEVIQTHLSRIWSFGVLAAAEQMLDAELQALRDAVARKKYAAQVAMKSGTTEKPTSGV